MKYSAPKQGTFAVIILISFCTTLLAFVIVGKHSEQRRQDKVVDFIANQIASDSLLPMSIKDKVGLSVLTNKYLINDTIGSVGFYDNDNQPLLLVGHESTRATNISIQQGSSILGSVKVTSAPVSHAQIIATGWLFILASLVLHSLTWLLYCYIARPDKQTIENISKHTRDALIAQGILNSIQHQNTPKTTIPDTPSASTHITNNQNLQKFDLTKSVSDLVKSNNLQNDAPHATKNSASDHQSPSSQSAFKQKMAHANSVVVIIFDDNNDLLELLADDLSMPYLTLCDELLQRCIQQLLKLTNLSDVHVIEIEQFSKTGAYVYFADNHDQSHQAIMAAAILAKMLPIANQIIYEKHRDIHKFALPMRALAISKDKTLHAKFLLKRYHEPSLLLTNAQASKKVSEMMNLTAPRRPSSIHEKECRFIGDVSDSLASQLHTAIIQALTQTEDA